MSETEALEVLRMDLQNLVLDKDKEAGMNVINTKQCL